MLPHPLKRPGEDRGPAARSLTDEAAADADKAGSRQAAPAGTAGRSSGRSPADSAQINLPGRRNPAGLGDQPFSPSGLCSSGSPRGELWRSGDVRLKSSPPARRVPRPPEGGVPAKPGAAARRAARETPPPPPPAPRPLPRHAAKLGGAAANAGRAAGSERRFPTAGAAAGRGQRTAVRSPRVLSRPRLLEEYVPNSAARQAFPARSRHRRKTRFPPSR